MSKCLMEHGFDPLLAVTSRSSRTLSGTIPLLFKRQDPSDVARAKACYRALVKVGLEHGWPPYRLGSDYMELIACPAESPSAQVQQLLKQALDANNIIAAGRYQHAQTLAPQKPLQAQPLVATQPSQGEPAIALAKAPSAAAFDYAMLFATKTPELKKPKRKETETI
jgi:4-cresol dehydrogenase (hydroxylating) flavoprotein subunit